MTPGTSEMFSSSGLLQDDRIYNNVRIRDGRVPRDYLIVCGTADRQKTHYTK